VEHEPSFCPHCGILSPVGPIKGHASPEACIAALRAAMIKQRKAASSLAFDLSTRYLAVLEELALDCGEPAGVQFKVRTPEGKIMVAHHSQVSGFFAAIMRKFEELGDWSPLRDAQERGDALELHAGLLLEVLEEILALNDNAEVGDQALLDKGHSRAEQAKQLGVRPPDRDRS
jgi:hypothetical protein